MVHWRDEVGVFYSFCKNKVSLILSKWLRFDISFIFADRKKLVDKEDSFIYLFLFVLFFFFFCKIYRYGKRFWFVRVRFLVETYSLQEIKWFYCSFRMSYRHVMNVLFLRGNWNKRRNEYLNSFFNFSALTTVRYWRDISNYNESMFWWNSLKFRRMVEQLFRGDIFSPF